MMPAGKSTKQALNALAVMFGQPKGSFTSILDAQPFFNALQQAQLENTIAQSGTVAEAKVGLSQKTEALLKADSGLLGSIYKEGLQGPGLSPAEQEFFSQQIGAEQAARGVYGSPVSAAQAGSLLGMYGIQRQMQRQDRALQILSALAPPAFGPSPQFNVPGNFGTQQQAALQGYSAYGQYYAANLGAEGGAYQGLGQFGGMLGAAAISAGLFGGGGGAAAGAATAAAAACWVAEVLYGKEHPKTHAARLYATYADTPFTRAYRKHGRAWAAWLTENPWAQPLVRPIWDTMAHKGEAIARACLALRQGG
jgi:hypothetical protein